MSGVIAIVGRPNVGKSALFNRIAGRRIAIVHDEPGVTRDRVTAEAEWKGVPFTLVDTGGIGLRQGEKAEDVILQAAVEQVEIAIASAHVILFVVNVQEGMVPLDQEVAERLRTAGKPVLLAANKADNPASGIAAVDFTPLGFEPVFPVSAIHGRGIDALMRAALEHLPPDDPSDTPVLDWPSPAIEGARVAPSPNAPLKLAIVGRPNVGKSSLINSLTSSNRVVVSPIPGTTRDAVDVPFEVETEGRRERYVLVDTAGVRKRRSIDNSIEFYSVKRTEDAIARSDISVLVLDAADGIREQDKKIGALITEARCACIVVVNKWDLVADSVRKAREEEIARRQARERRRSGATQRMTTLGEFGKWVQEKLFFLDYAPVIFTSAHTGFHLDRFLEAVRYVGAQLRQQIPTAVLNRTLHDAVVKRQPLSRKGEHLKFYYATQTGHSPPRFTLFLNRADLFNRAYEKYLTNELRAAFGYEGCPIVLVPRARPKSIEPVRRTKPAESGQRASGTARRASAARRRTGARSGSKPAGSTGRSSRPSARQTRRGGR